jgi:hypothetical protein
VDTIRIHSGRHQSLLDRIGPAFTESQVIFKRAALVIVSLDRELDVGILRQKVGIP